MSDLTELMSEAWQIAEDKGFHDGRTFGDACALLHSEVTEAFEAVRHSGKNGWIEVDGKPEGALAEIADVVIRAFDTALFDLGADAEEFATVIQHKMEYNKRRPFRWAPL